MCVCIHIYMVRISHIYIYILFIYDYYMNMIRLVTWPYKCLCQSLNLICTSTWWGWGWETSHLLIYRNPYKWGKNKPLQTLGLSFVYPLFFFGNNGSWSTLAQIITQKKRGTSPKKTFQDEFAENDAPPANDACFSTVFDTTVFLYKNLGSVAETLFLLTSEMLESFPEEQPKQNKP